MDLIELLSLFAGLMTMSAPITQAWKTWRRRDYEGLSAGSYLLLLCLGTLAVLIGIQYGIVTMIVLNSIGLSANLLMMWMISRKTLGAYLISLGTVLLVLDLAAPWFVAALLTPRWVQQVAFVYGIFAAATFMPQVLLTRKSRVVSALSIINLILFASGMAIWIVVSVLLGNYSLIFWNAILLLMLFELLRLKIVIDAENRTTAAGGTIAPLKGQRNSALAFSPSRSSSSIEP